MWASSQFGERLAMLSRQFTLKTEEANGST